MWQSIQPSNPTDCSDISPSITVVISMCPKRSLIETLAEDFDTLEQTKVFLCCRNRRIDFREKHIPVVEMSKLFY